MSPLPIKCYTSILLTIINAFDDAEYAHPMLEVVVNRQRRLSCTDIGGMADGDRSSTGLIIIMLLEDIYVLKIGFNR